MYFLFKVFNKYSSKEYTQKNKNSVKFVIFCNQIYNLLIWLAVVQMWLVRVDYIYNIQAYL